MPLTDDSTIEMFKELMEDAFSPMLEEYISHTASTVDVIKNNIPDGDVAEVKLAAHSVKSTSLQFGFPDMGESARALEAACSEGDVASLVALRENYISTAESTLAVARDMLKDE